MLPIEFMSVNWIKFMRGDSDDEKKDFLTDFPLLQIKYELFIYRNSVFSNFDSFSQSFLWHSLLLHLKINSLHPLFLLSFFVFRQRVKSHKHNRNCFGKRKAAHFMSRCFLRSREHNGISSVCESVGTSREARGIIFVCHTF